MSNVIKPITMYLPQFHRTQENDEWWGEGFTEWTAVKKGERLFEGHDQPKVPFDGNYYDLLQKETMVYQADLMKKYGVYGMCFYHYYFEDGRKVLHKPAENLLEWKEIDMPYCFCWANESWGRTWSKLHTKNIWAEKFEKVKNHDDNGILLRQKYGMKKEWKKHFEYLLPFFKDKRYIRKDGRLVFLLYRPSNIYCVQQMIDYWQELAGQHGIGGFYFIGMNITQKKHGLDALLLNAPLMFNQEIRYKEGGINKYSYDVVWKKILEAGPVKDSNTYYGGFVNYDDTPRRSKNGVVVDGFTPEKFKKYLGLLARKNLESDNEYLFINAWNEWGEGMYLEPDVTYGFACLEAVKHVVDTVKNIPQKFHEIKKEDSTLQYYQNEANRQKIIANCLDRWITLKEKQMNPIEYIKERNWKKIALYGMGKLGLHFMHELSQCNEEVAYIIDKRSEMQYPGIDVISPDDCFPKADVLVVTAVADFDEVYQKCKAKFSGDIISLEQIIYECE